LVGQLAARCGAARVFLTDVGDEVLANCAANVEADTHPGARARCRVRELDWKEAAATAVAGGESAGAAEEAEIAVTRAEAGRGARVGAKAVAGEMIHGTILPWEQRPGGSPAGVQMDATDQCRGEGGGRDDGDVGVGPTSISGVMDQSFAWTPDDVDELQRCDLILAADCVYDDDLTDAFFAALARVLSTCCRRRDRDYGRARACVADTTTSKASGSDSTVDATYHNSNRPLPPRPPPPRAMCAMERRLNFGLGDDAPRAHAFERFLSHLGLTHDPVSGGVRVAPTSAVPTASRGVFRGRRVDLFEAGEPICECTHIPSRSGINRQWSLSLQVEPSHAMEQQ